MGKEYAEIEPKLADWIRAQRLFFVGSAPSEGGHVNVSPKGPIETLRVIDGRTVEYDDFVGSGIETAAHLQENGRIVVMLCAFEGPPRIVRLHGQGEVVLATDPGDGVRATIRVAVDRVADSCGYGVPLMRYEGERPQHDAWLDRKGADGVRAYVAERNARSIDGLPGI